MVFTKKYFRLLSYFFIFILVLLFLRYAQIKNTNGIDYLDYDDYVIVQIGFIQCFNVFSFEYCPRILHTTGKSAHTNRHIIKKDINGRISNLQLSTYLYYDFLPKSMAKIGYITGIDTEPVNGQYSKLTDDIYVSRHGTTIPPLKGIDVLFNINYDPRRNWSILKDVSNVVGSKNTTISVYMHSHSASYHVTPDLKLSKDRFFKIVQLSDLHFSVGPGICRDEFQPAKNCQADAKTIRFIEEVLDIENPDLIVFSGDQIMGNECKLDSTSALLKVVIPIVTREIPWTMVWGNHDDEGSLSRRELSQLASKLPFSMFQLDPYHDTSDNTFGMGNYIHKVKDFEGREVVTLIFLDSHKYTSSGKTYRVYDYIKEPQLEYIKNNLGPATPLSLAFFHIPLPEYVNIDSKSQPGTQNKFVGTVKEGVTAPRFNSGALKVFKDLNIQVVSVGHDHLNDYCLLDDSFERKTWLCYGGGTGEGGYGGYGGTERRIRIYEIDTKDMSIHSWKRLNGSPNKKIDEQLLVQGCEAL